MTLNRIFAPSVAASTLTVAFVFVVGSAWMRETSTLSARPVRASRLVGPSCPLTLVQQKRSITAWKAMMPIFRHPRCSNCHGGIPSPLPGEHGATIRHVNVVDMDSTDNGDTCEQCHMDQWRQQQSAPNWADKTDTDICRGMHIVFEESAPAFLDHIVRDGGGTPFIDLAYAGMRGLTDGGQTIAENELGHKIVAEPPPGSHAYLIALAKMWIAAQGGSFVGDKNCGCEIPESGELYSLSIVWRNTNAFSGFKVSDSVMMKVRIKDTVVTVSDIQNFPPRSDPERITTPSGYIAFDLDPIGGANVVEAKGEIAIDFPSEGERGLKIDFTHKLTDTPAFWIVRTVKPQYRQKQGGVQTYGLPLSSQWTLVEGKKVYEAGGPDMLFQSKLTLISVTK